MTLTGNVTSSTTSGTPKNGNLLSLTLIQDIAGGHTFSFPANFVLPTGFTFDTGANRTNALTFKFDGTNWNLVSNGGGGTTPPANPNNILQKNLGGTFGASSISDDGTTVTVGNNSVFSGTASITGALTTATTATIGGQLSVNADTQFKGPNPGF